MEQRELTLLSNEENKIIKALSSSVPMDQGIASYVYPPCLPYIPSVTNRHFNY